MFRQFAINTTRRAVAQRSAFQQRKTFSTTPQFQKDEGAAERDFIHKEERNLLENLSALQRKRSELDYAQQMKSLNSTLVAHKIEPNPALVQDLMKWRLTQ
jgi:hypothetical protein